MNLIFRYVRDKKIEKNYGDRNFFKKFQKSTFFDLESTKKSVFSSDTSYQFESTTIRKSVFFLSRINRKHSWSHEKILKNFDK